METRSTVKIPANLIDVQREQTRPISPARMVQLEAAIAANPQAAGTIVVRPVGERYQLVSGRRALLALLSMGQADIDARIRKGKKSGRSK
jgi:hypothetical protein